MFKNKRTLLFILFLVLIVSTILLLRSRENEPSPLEPATTPAPQISEPIQKPIPERKNPSQKLSFIWRVPEKSFPSSLPYLTINKPLINPDSIAMMSKVLEFSETDKIDVKVSHTFLWANQDHSLNATTGQNITYLKNQPPASGPFDEQTVLGTANRLMSLLFPETASDFIQKGEIKFNRLEGGFSAKANQNNAQTATVGYQQRYNNVPIISDGPDETTISVTINPNDNIQALTILGGFEELTPSTPFALLNPHDLVQIAQLEARRLPGANESLSLTRQIDISDKVQLTVTDIQLVYLSLPGQLIIQPAYLLEGSFSGSFFKSQNGRYIIPALKN